MALRAEFAINHALKGFDLDFEEALEMLRESEDGLSEEDKARRDIVVAAVDNLVDFAVAEEYQMANELPDWEGGIDDDVEEEALKIFAKYNDRYAKVENMDIEYAMMVAAGLVTIANSTVLTYMTQGDERVRPWHLQYEGFSAPKHQFPAWLVPPIEHACRCYLIEDSVVNKACDVQNAALKTPEMPEWFNRTFKECVAFGGRIFSDEHPYFQINELHNSTLQDIAARIKSRYFNG